MKMQNYFADTEKQIMKNRSMTNTIDYARLGILVMDKARFLHSTGNSATLAIVNSIRNQAVKDGNRSPSKVAHV